MLDISVAIINGSRYFEGTYVASINLYYEFSKYVSTVNWYQCIDPVDYESHKSFGKSVLGIRFPLRFLEMGINRLFVFPSKLRSLDEDIIVVCDLSLMSIVKDLDKKIIVKITDLRPLSKYSDNFLTSLMYRHQIKKLTPKMEVIASTQFVKREISRYTNARVNIIPEYFIKNEQIDTQKKKNLLSKNENEPIKVIYVAQDRQYKNIKFFVSIAKAFYDEGNSKVTFILVSKLRNRTIRYIRNLKMNNLTVKFDLPDLTEIYDVGDIMAYVSSYEGFGIPVIEAMSKGIPVLLQDIEPFRETAGAAGIYINQLITSDWVREIKRLISYPTLYDQKSAESTTQSTKFSEENMASGVKDLLKHVSDNMLVESIKEF